MRIGEQIDWMAGDQLERVDRQTKQRVEGEAPDKGGGNARQEHRHDEENAKRVAHVWRCRLEQKDGKWNRDRHRRDDGEKLPFD